MFLVLGLIGAIRDFGPVSAGDLFFMHVNVNNDGVKDLDDLMVRVLIYDLATIFQSNSFDLNDGDTTGKIISWDVPSYVQPGDYWARITVSNDDVREVKHRLITIV
ncbi:MAG: hypothetical protein IH934_02340 [Nanoarchaeota archaeon]|nr:hypothetical protein [Nanoarchaeota archaeon]